MAFSLIALYFIGLNIIWAVLLKKNPKMFKDPGWLLFAFYPLFIPFIPFIYIAYKSDL